MLYLTMILMTICPIDSNYEDYCVDAPYDPYKIEKPDPIWFEGHLWQPIMLDHHKDCPCNHSTRD